MSITTSDQVCPVLSYAVASIVNQLKASFWLRVPAVRDSGQRPRHRDERVQFAAGEELGGEKCIKFAAYWRNLKLIMPGRVGDQLRPFYILRHHLFLFNMTSFSMKLCYYLSRDCGSITVNNVCTRLRVWVSNLVVNRPFSVPVFKFVQWHHVANNTRINQP